MTYKTDADDSRVDKVQSVAGTDSESPSDRAMRLAGDVLPFPKPLAESDWNRLKGENNFKDTPVQKFDPMGDVTGGGKVIPGPGYTD